MPGTNVHPEPTANEGEDNQKIWMEKKKESHRSMIRPCLHLSTWTLGGFRGYGERPFPPRRKKGKNHDDIVFRPETPKKDVGKNGLTQKSSPSARFFFSAFPNFFALDHLDHRFAWWKYPDHRFAWSK